MTDITLPREVAEQVLEALEDLGMKHHEDTGEVLYKDVYTALRERLAQPEQPPIKESSITHGHLWIGDLYGKEKNQ